MLIVVTMPRSIGWSEATVMSFRRNKQDSRRTKAWHHFLVETRELLVMSGVPLRIHETLELWEDFLMHGYLDHHPDEPAFSIDELTTEQKALLKEIIARYLQAGFDDPGLGIFSAAEREEIKKTARS